MSNLSAENVGRLRELPAKWRRMAEGHRHNGSNSRFPESVRHASKVTAVVLEERADELEPLLPALLQLAEAVMRAPVGTIEACEFGDFIRPAWVVVDDRQTVALNEPKRVRLVPDGGEV